jgi:hypothetical protein
LPWRICRRVKGENRHVGKGIEAMRKALITIIMAATVLTPIAAQAQDRGRGRGGDGTRGERPQNAEERSQRVQQREERQVRQEAPQQQAQPAPVEVVQRQRGEGRRGGGDGNRGNWNRGGNDTNRAVDQGQRWDREQRGDRGDRRRTDQPSVYPQAWQGDPNDPRLRHYQELERRNQQNYGRRDNRRDDRRDWRNDRRDDRGSNWDRGWRNDRRYDWRSYRNSNRNIFRGSRYYSPYRNYGYNRFSIGLFLEPLFYSRNYWIGNPWQYRLPAAYPGTQWVRYYNDVLLVDVYSGEVLDVIYDFFW